MSQRGNRNRPKNVPNVLSERIVENVMPAVVGVISFCTTTDGIVWTGSNDTTAHQGRIELN
ncbi:hypothetical protein [Halococcus agarilyticus]|uniref:hypothetical protein n=1 Tax=Halococcus agarilyticus TaxID=1232219 RepID=UPI0006779AB2|nr:hypothetical protein [Halococcus agarilyticus]